MYNFKWSFADNCYSICEKLKIHSEDKKAAKLKEYSDVFLNTACFEGRDQGKVICLRILHVYLLLYIPKKKIDLIFISYWWHFLIDHYRYITILLYFYISK